MSASVYHTELVDHEQMTQEQWAALTAFNNQIRAEMWPDDPPRTVEETITQMRSLPPIVDFSLWIVRPLAESRIVASGNVVTFENVDHNQHLAEFNISVLSERRRQGIAKSLLGQIAGVVRERNRRLLITGTDSYVPSGEAFMKRIGAEAALESRANKLDLADVDRELLTAWQRRAQERASDFELGVWEGPYPEADIGAIVTMKEVMNTAPRGDLDVEDFTWTTEHLRQMEAMMAQRQQQRWTMYARHKETRDLAGYTEVRWDPHSPASMDQLDTAVFPEYRNRGIGRWLKAAMLEKVLHERPQVERIITGNADANAPMLKINHELGFKLYKSWITWQIELQKVEAYLGEA